MGFLDLALLRKPWWCMASSNALNYHFPTGLVFVGHGEARRTGQAYAIDLSIERGEVQTPEICSPFLNGLYASKGRFKESCRPNNSLLKVGKVAGLYLSHGQRTAYSIVQVVILNLADVKYESPQSRGYVWDFAVVESTYDDLRLNPYELIEMSYHSLPANPDCVIRRVKESVKEELTAEPMELMELLALIGASVEELAKVKMHLKLSSEGAYIIQDTP